MAITQIGQLNLQIAELEAQGIERGAQELRGLGSGIGSVIDRSLEGAEMLQQQAIREEKDKEVQRLLNSGVEGVNAYSSELGFDPATAQMFGNMAEAAKMSKDQSQFAKIYQLQKSKADTDAAKLKRNQILSTIQTDLKDAMDTADPDKIAKVGNAINAAKASTTDKDTIKQLESIEKGLNSVRQRTGRTGKPGEATKGIINLRKEFRTESGDIDTILRQTDVLRTAFEDGSFEGNRVGSDQALIMTFNKILDPTSVVRESEFARTGQSQGALDATAGWFKKLVEGGSGLTEDGRKAVFKMSELISQGAMIDRFRKVQEFERLGEIEEIPADQMDLIVPGFSKYKADYEQWKRNPEAYKERITKELNDTLKEATREEVKFDAPMKTPSKKKRRIATSIEEF